MKKDLLRHAINKYRKRKGWQVFVRALAVCVVFCTTYALILPAITMQEDTVCGLEAHVHTDGCYALPAAALTGCALPADAVIVHQHNELCFDEAGTLRCALPETLVHLHDDSCYTQESVLACVMTHVHSEDCTGTESVLICQMPESEGHTHSESCTATVSVLICTDESHEHADGCFEEQTVMCEIPETEGHIHGENCFAVNERICIEQTAQEHTHEAACYLQVDALTCGLEELQLHSHEEGCFDAEGTLICGLPAVVEHIHTEECLAVPADAEPVLICNLEEHIHDTVCYPLEEVPVFGLTYLCGYSVHTHNENCCGEDGSCVCNIPEHVHEAACVAEEVDMTADVETEEDWMRSVSGMTLSGNWPADVLAVAQTQLGYRESTKNLVLTDEVLKGYTRYGAWKEDPYADWNTLFAAFCLDYAAVKDFPVETVAADWVRVLTENQLYLTADSYAPKPGDLIFIDQDQVENGEETVEPVADWVAIVEELIPATEDAPAGIRIIAGDRDDQVSRLMLEADDVTVIGYAPMPAGNLFWKTYEGPDYTVSVTLTAESMLPETVCLEVREILSGTEEYDLYYNQSLQTLTDLAADEEQPAISFARFFDISFLVDGVVTEPAAPVDIQIVYSDAIPVAEEEAGQVVHFAKDGVEVLHTSTDLTEEQDESGILDEITEFFDGETEQVDTFRFTQGSFSVTGTLVSTRAATYTATKVQPYEIDNTGGTLYVLYAWINNRYYAIDGNGTPRQITVNGNSVTLPADNPANLMWRFVDKPGDGHYLYNPVTNEGTGRYLHPFDNSSGRGVTTSGPWDLQLIVNNDSFQIQGDNSNRIVMNEWSANPQRTTNATVFYVARVDNFGGTYQVWFDGTLGGMMSYYGAANENRPVIAEANGTAVVELPETWGSSTKYDYKLRGWYDINTQTYYPVNPDDNVQPTANITGSTVFYADWIASTYDVGQDNDHVVSSLDTSDFVTTYVFDYNALFNVLSQTHTGTITAGGHSETWTIHNNGETVPYRDQKSLGFAFVDYDNGGEFSYANGRDTINTNQSGITSGILQRVNGRSGQDLLDLLFNPATDVIGKYYAGTGNYLFQYMDSTTDNYDGEHDGYYYLDARLNAASYNQSQQRFYLYDYLERTSDSRKDGGAGQYSDLLPFNSPYIFGEDQLDSYTDTVRMPGYEYDAKDGGNNHPEYNSLDDATTNYFFGLRTDIEFFLPNDTNTQDEYGNYGNISTRGEHMIFEFHGDDDVWVFVDGQLILDIGGLHGIMHGRIDFSTGTIAYGPNGDQNVSSLNLSEGNHTMTVYYMERGSSQSNCAIYFNIAPRYDLEITKEDIVTASYLDGAVFSVFSDEAMTEPAELWYSYAEYQAGVEPSHTFTVVNGVAKCWGISAGKTYYIYETTPPPGYPASDDVIRVTLNNRGTATIEATTLHGSNGVATEGFAVIKQEINETLKVVALTVTNQKEGEHTEVRVEKSWAEGSDNLPQSITVYLTADGVPVGRRAVLDESHGWSYTWTGLDKYRAGGIDEEIVYEVQEVLVPGFITTQGTTQKVVDHVDWIRVDEMSDNKTFLLVHNGQALTYDGWNFGWMDIETAELESSLSAQWAVTTDHDGFHLKNGLGYTLTYRASGFYGVNDDSPALNQVFYYLNSRLVVHDHDVYYQFGSNGNVVTEDGLAFTLYQKEVMTGFLTNIINVPVDKEDQTYVEVTKVWSDGYENHTQGAVIIRLLSDGKDTGRYITLSADNNWTGGFYELPYYREDGQTVVVYTVVEDEIPDYAAEYSGATVLPALPIEIWGDTNTITAGGVYRFASGGHAMAIDDSGNVVSAYSDTNDVFQQWNAVADGYRIVLQNVGTGQYLAATNNRLSLVTQVYQAAAVTIDRGLVKLGQRYLEITSSHVGLTYNSANITNQKITTSVTVYGKEGTGYTVTNRYGTYTLPQTGGMGTSHFTFGGLLLIAVALMYICKSGRKQRKGGKYSQ